MLMVGIHQKHKNTKGKTMIKQQLNTILQKEMDRKSFLKHIGIAAIAVMGVPAVLKSFDSLGGGKSAERTVAGYGSSAYGGRSSQVN